MQFHVDSLEIISCVDFAGTVQTHSFGFGEFSIIPVNDSQVSVPLRALIEKALKLNVNARLIISWNKSVVTPKKGNFLLRFAFTVPLACTNCK